jgi:hypothetical protein
MDILNAGVDLTEKSPQYNSFTVFSNRKNVDRRMERKMKNGKNSNSTKFQQKAIDFRAQYKGGKRKHDAEVFLMYLSQFYDVSVDELRGKSRKQPLPYIRKVFSYFADNYLDLSHRHIADLIGRERSTIVTNVQEMAAYLDFYLGSVSEAQIFDNYFNNLIKRRN